MAPTTLACMYDILASKHLECYLSMLVHDEEAIHISSRGTQYVPSLESVTKPTLVLTFREMNEAFINIQIKNTFTVGQHLS